MLQFFAANDVCNNSRKLDPDTARPYYTLDGERLVLDDSFLQDPERVRFQTSSWIRLKDAVVQHSRVAALIYQFRHQKPAPVPTDGAEAGLAMQAFHEPDQPRLEGCLGGHRSAGGGNVATKRQPHGAEFVVLMANCGVEVDPQDAVRQRVLERLGVTDLLYPERRMAALGAAHGFTVIRLGRGHAQVLPGSPGVRARVRQHPPGHRALE